MDRVKNRILIITSLLSLAISLRIVAQSQHPGYSMVWNDEFESEAIDRSKWAFDGGAGGFGNNEMQWYSNKSENARIEDGCLVIETRRQKTAGWPYTSAKLMSRADWKYGYFEVRAKLPTGVGSWPAIWMLPRDPKAYGSGWPDAGELDLMEHVGYDPGVIHFTAHTGAFNHKLGTQKTQLVRVPDAQSAFHIYTIEWTSEQVRFLLDGQEVHVFRNLHETYREWPFDTPFYLILNIAAGGDWGGLEGVDNESLPWRMMIDWVRVYRADD